MTPRKQTTAHQVLIGFYAAFRALSWRSHLMQLIRQSQHTPTKKHATPPKCPSCRLFVKVPPCPVDQTCPYCPVCCPGHDKRKDG